MEIPQRIEFSNTILGNRTLYRVLTSPWKISKSAAFCTKICTLGILQSVNLILFEKILAPPRRGITAIQCSMLLQLRTIHQPSMNYHEGEWE